MKKIAKLMCVLFAVSLFAGMAVAGDGANPKKGKYLWKKNCKTCHIDGEEGGSISPSSKTQKQWSNFFEKDQDEVIMQKCKKYGENDLHDIQHYMNDHAMDSDQPETCG